ncbi:MAG TPA: hypothetical protein VKU61_09220 [Candidatus Binatia bacterium]|nr:hypothetical protein [Candidatus Binatia bacterium]
MPDSARRDAVEPRFVTEERERGADPLAVYAETYRAMETDAGRRRSYPPRSVVIPIVLGFGVIVAAVEIGGIVRTPVGALLSAFRRAPAVVRPLKAPRPAYAPDVIGTTPARPKAAVRVGDEQVFAVAASGPDLHYGWTLDGVPAGTSARWTFAPRPGDLGRRRVEVVVTTRGGAERRAWSVLVRPPLPPDVVTEPPAGQIEVKNETPIKLKVKAEPAARGERVRVTSWSVDGSPAGQGETFTLRADRPGPRTVRALVVTDLGATAIREWRVDVPGSANPVIVAEKPPEPAAAAPQPEERPRPEEPTRLAARPEPAPAAKPEPVPSSSEPVETPPVVVAQRPTPPPAVPPVVAKELPAEPPAVVTARPAEPVPAARVPEPQVPVARPVEPPPQLAAREPEAPPRRTERMRRSAEPVETARPPERLARDEEIRRWLDRYATAWRTHDVEMLRRMGQVTSEREAQALREYFDRVSDLDVELNVIALRDEGDRTTVVFTRRDRFRDPAGRLVLKESPTLEKEIIRTPDGLRFARPTG